MAGCQRGQRGGKKRKRHSDNGWSGWGGYMNAKIDKLAKQGSPEKRVSNIFKDVAIFVNGYTKPPQNELKRLILENGGAYHHYYSRTKVTHIIASNLPTSKIVQLRDEKVVKPDWITESLRAGRLVPYQNYLLHDPKASGHKTSLFTSLRKSVASTSSPSSGVCDLVSNETDSALVGTSITTLEDDLFPCDEVESSEVITANNGISFMETDQNIAPSIDSECLLTKTLENPSDVTENVARDSMRPAEMTNRTAATAVTRAGDPGFVSEFYSHSRLHHLSTWGAEFKAYVTSLQGQGNLCYPGREKLRHIVALRDHVEQQSVPTEQGNVARQQRIMMHIDMDCFFVSVALRNRPELKGRPVAVTHSKGKGPAHNETACAAEEALWHQRTTGGKQTASTSANKPFGQSSGLNGASGQPLVQPANKDIFYSMAEVASCSYEARKAGVKNGMLFGKAKQLCPDLIPLPYDFEGYKEVSQQLYDTVGSYTLEMEAVSCDELYIDCSDVVADTGASPLEFSSLLRQEIFEKTGCTASAGLGGNMLLARLATKVAKPNGQFWVEPENISNFVKNVLVSDLPGVGRVLSNKLESLNIKTCEQLGFVSLPQLQKHFGQKTGQMLFQYARGADERTLKTAVERKSVSAEINYGIRFTKMSEAEKFLGELSAEVQSRLKNINRKGKTVTLKLKMRRQDAPKVTAKFMGHGVCDSLCKSSTLPVAADSAEIIAQECCSLLRHISVDPEDLRGMGIQMTSLEAPIGHSTSSGCRSILDFAAPAVKDPSNFEPRQASIETGKTAAAKSRPAISVASVGQPPLCSNFALMQTGSRHSSNGSSRPFFLNGSSCIIKKSTDSDSLPPLPSLGGVNLSLGGTEQTTVADRPAQVCYDDDPYLPSPSQIDERVLAELPADIQMEIREALKKKRRKLGPEFIPAAEPEEQRKNSETDAIVLVDEEKPGCSHWTDESRSRITKTIHDPLALPPYSQLDASYMNALPDELREEIESAYAAGSKEQNNKNLEAEMMGFCASPPQKELHPLMRANIKNSCKQPPNKITSPLKKNSPKKSPAKKSSPSFKKPNGKPPGKRKNLVKKQIQFPAKAVAPLTQAQILATTESSIHGCNNGQMTTGSHLTSEAPKPHESEVSVAGCVTLSQVKGLLRTWMQMSSVPDDENLETFFLYLARLIEAKNLERVNILLKFINRLQHDGSLSSEWKTGSQWLIDQTQSVIQSLYGGPIKLPNY